MGLIESCSKQIFYPAGTDEYYRAMQAHIDSLSPEERELEALACKEGYEAFKADGFGVDEGVINSSINRFLEREKKR